MKRITSAIYLLMATAVSFSLIYLTSCKGSDPEPDLLTSKTWTLESALVDGADKTSLFANMTLTFTDGGFSTTNGGGVWPASGTWQYGTSKSIIVRGDGLSITIDEISSDKLKLSFIWTKDTFGSGRLSSVSGENVFTFK